MARISKPPVPAKMYKHFAVVTVMLTFMIALFADGETQQTIAEHQRQAELQAASRQVTAPPTLARRGEQVVGSFGDEGLDGFGNPTDETGASAGTTFTRQSSRNDRQLLPNMTREEVAALSQEEYERLRALYVAAGAIEDIDQSAHLSAAEDASARRMGHRGSDS
ncbi:hypothetical protein OZN62_01205 [Aurantiacibacter sp. MUD11]|uniref:hypothetical protein n=1 Tax=Aurantiacibacter sp. MUD11 TaxID=3003265 RepID=UPI0022AAD268|nr:hypothetical protein [Aurantiacibacter sp. MUD11]WAT18224.1 hypothetical protein OZN62_01205 [Aurantiacibacter sp. MUD11]